MQEVNGQLMQTEKEIELEEQIENWTTATHKLIIANQWAQKQ